VQLRPISRSSKLAVIAALAAIAAPAVSLALDQTKVSVFTPAVPDGQHRSGDCWTDSIAISRPGVWRCMVGNEIYDPCFTVPKLTGALVCDARPTGGPGFVLDLTKPLPKQSLSPPKFPLPWLLKLADGSVCEVETGTVSRVDGHDLPFACSDSRATALISPA
jgi:hypothetical protein